MKTENGFSPLEILVAIVILAIVVLNLSNVTVAGIKELSHAKEKETASQLALEKLAELRNPSGCISNGESIITRDEMDYTVNWQLSGVSAITATIEVQWMAKKQSRVIVLSEYIRTSHSSRLIRSNKAPSAIKVYSVSSDEITDNIVRVPATISIGDVVATIEVIDPDSDAGDIVVTSLAPTGKDNALFTFTNNMLKVKEVLAEARQNYSVAVQAVDCAGNERIKTFTIHIETDTEQQTPQTVQNVNLQEITG